jgi:hypothetical protein
MSKIVGRRNADGQIVMLPKPVISHDLTPGDIRFYRGQYQECRRPGLIHYYWRDVTAEVAVVLRQTFVTTAPAPQEPTP